MTAVATLTGASSDIKVCWHTIDWRAAGRHVGRLQARIVKAVQEKRYGKAKALQHLLTHSFSAKALAVKRVTENQGHRTPGVDAKVWNTPVSKAQAVDSLRQRGYQAQPLRRI
jgi:RNA-directed DNA polymerase